MSGGISQINKTVDIRWHRIAVAAAWQAWQLAVGRESWACELGMRWAWRGVLGAGGHASMLHASGIPSGKARNCTAALRPRALRGSASHKCPVRPHQPQPSSLPLLPLPPPAQPFATYNL